MRVLQVSKFLPPPYAGIEAHVEQLIATLSPEVPCELLVSEVGWQRRPAAHRPFPVHGARTVKTVASTALSPAMPLMMRRWAQEHRDGIVHVHLPNPMADVSTWMLPKGYPLVITWHSDIIRQKRLLKIYQPIMSRLLKRADRVIVFTPKHLSSSTQLLEVPSQKLRIVPVAIDPGRFTVTAEVAQAMHNWRQRLGSGVVIATVGRHIYYKGYEYLVEAMAKLPPSTQLVMVGKGPLTLELMARAKALGIEHRVHFAGSIGDVEMVGLLRVCDIFSLPSIEPSEAFGLATAEAMLCGKPCVVCELGNGVNYLNRPEVTGLTVPPRDVDALSGALRRLVEDRDLRLRLGQGALDWVQTEFSPDRMRAGTLAVYRELR